MREMNDDQDRVDAAMEQFESWRSSRKPVYVAIHYEEQWVDLEGTITEIDRFVRFQDAFGLYKMDFLPHMFVHVSLETTDEGTTIKCEQSPLGPDIEISDIHRRPAFADVEARTRSVH